MSKDKLPLKPFPKLQESSEAKLISPKPSSILRLTGKTCLFKRSVTLLRKIKRAGFI